MAFERSALFDHTTAICPFTSCPKSNLDKTEQNLVAVRNKQSIQRTTHSSSGSYLGRNPNLKSRLGSHRPENAATA
eukprot:1692630-Pyramimonas_sp.AAC.1